MKTSLLMAMVTATLMAACGEEDHPAPAGGGTGGGGGAQTGGAGGSGNQDSGPGCLDDWTLADGTPCAVPTFCIANVGCGLRCLDDHTQEQVGATFSCGGHYCIVGEGCHLTCDSEKDCRPGFVCETLGPGLKSCAVK